MATSNLYKLFPHNDYCRATKVLKEKVEFLASMVRFKMYDLDLEELNVDGMVLRVSKVKANSGYCYEFLSVDPYYGEEGSSGSLEDINNSYYYSNDFSCHVEGANSKTALRFANNARKIVDCLNEIENSQTEAVNHAIEELETLTTD